MTVRQLRQHVTCGNASAVYEIGGAHAPLALGQKLCECDKAVAAFYYYFSRFFAGYCERRDLAAGKRSAVFGAYFRKLRGFILGNDLGAKYLQKLSVRCMRKRKRYRGKPSYKVVDGIGGT